MRNLPTFLRGDRLCENASFLYVKNRPAFLRVFFGTPPQPQIVTVPSKIRYSLSSTGSFGSRKLQF
jgi:hypothetical protein